MTFVSAPIDHPGNGFAPASPDPKAAPVPSLLKRVLDNAFAGGRHLRYDGGEFHRFVGTHWATVSKAEIGGAARPYLDAGSFGSRRMPVIRDLVDQLAVTTSGRLESRAALEATPIINVANGELWFGPDGTVVLRPHAPESQQQHCLGYDYDPKATCPAYDRAIAEILGEERAKIWDEQAGYVLQQTRPRPHLAVAVGKEGDGKSLLTGVLTKLLGQSQVLASPVEDLTASRFSLSALAGKRMFLDDDVSAGVRLPDGILKKMSEGRPVSGERKSREGLTFTLRAVPFIVGNNVPRLDDRSLGFRRRLMVFEFRRSFADHEIE